MKKAFWTISAAILLGALVVPPAIAGGPTVSKQVLAKSDGASILLIRVAAGSRAIYGVTIEDPSGSIEDVFSPNGWCSVSVPTKASFLTGQKPIKKGKSISFRILTKDDEAKLNVSFRDNKSAIGKKKSI